MVRGRAAALAWLAERGFTYRIDFVAERIIIMNKEGNYLDSLGLTKAEVREWVLANQ